MRRTLLAFAASAMLAGPMMATPSDTFAANQKQGDGLVNVQVGDITLQNVSALVAAQVIANLCDLVDITDVEVLTADILAFDATGTRQQIDCNAEGDQGVTLKQNSKKG